MTIRVLVVEDSLTVRMRLVELIDSHPDFEVVGQAEDGKTGIELCQRLKPDIITLDMMLPVMTGLAATEYIMAYCPTPIVIVSASTNRGELFRTYEALAAGAVDVLEKPLGNEPAQEWEERLISTLRIASRVKVITHPRLRLPTLSRVQPRDSSEVDRVVPSGLRRLVALGASTGGPSATLTILRNLPPKFPLPILMVMHIGEPFGAALAEWLDGQLSMGVRLAKDGESLSEVYRRAVPGVIMAPPGYHLVLKGDRLTLVQTPMRHSCRPSVDELFESLAAHVGNQCIAALLTGMGRDGADGLLALRRAGARTIAQDEATSVVFGMPREAILIGAAEQVLPLERIGPTLNALATQHRAEGSAR